MTMKTQGELTFVSKKGTMFLQLSAEFVQKAIEMNSIGELNEIIALMNLFEERYSPASPNLSESV